VIRFLKTNSNPNEVLYSYQKTIIIAYVELVHFMNTEKNLKALDEVVEKKVKPKLKLLKSQKTY
jgi:hypothetical protein